MTSTIPPTVNRVSGYFQKPLPEVPDDEFERQALYGETIMEAVIIARELLKHSDKSIVLKAVQELFTLERTRLRHHRQVVGCRVKPIPKWQSDLEWKECLIDVGPPSPERLENDAFDAHAKDVQAELRKEQEAKPLEERKKVHSQAGRALVQRCLKAWKVTAQSIPAGGFWVEYLRNPVEAKKMAPRSPGPKKTVAQTPVPRSSIPQTPAPRRIDPTLVADWNVDFSK